MEKKEKRKATVAEGDESYKLIYTVHVCVCVCECISVYSIYMDGVEESSREEVEAISYERRKE